MKRLAILTVGKTHSGKTTFAKALAERLANSIVIDQDSHVEFLYTYYRNLLPKKGPNTIKYAITKTIFDHAIHETNGHLILCNSNRNRQERLALLKQFHAHGFLTILVHFAIPDSVLEDRVAKSRKSIVVLRSASSFHEVLTRQQSETEQHNYSRPAHGEAAHFFELNSEKNTESIIQEILAIAQLTD